MFREELYKITYVANTIVFLIKTDYRTEISTSNSGRMVNGCCLRRGRQCCGCHWNHPDSSIKIRVINIATHAIPQSRALAHKATQLIDTSAAMLAGVRSAFVNVVFAVVAYGTLRALTMVAILVLVGFNTDTGVLTGGSVTWTNLGVAQSTSIFLKRQMGMQIPVVKNKVMYILYSST